jgi:hypothetical protein
MIFYRLNRPAQVALIGAALAAPGCYLSHGDPDDDADARDTRDARDDGDTLVVDDVPDSWEVRDDVEPDMVVDCVPYPNCSDIEAGALGVTAVEASSTWGVADVKVAAPAVPAWSPLECSGYPCLAVTPEGGVGTVSDVTWVDPTTIRFRYTNAAMTWGDMIRLDLSWRFYCDDPSTGFRETTLAGTAWACRDDSFNIMITGSEGECPMVIDCAPMPMARSEPSPGAPSSGALSLQARSEADGTVRLRASGPAGTRSYRWLASGGTLRMVSDAEAVFEPERSAGLFMVQVAAFTRAGVTIQVFRRRGEGGGPRFRT